MDDVLLSARIKKMEYIYNRNLYQKILNLGFIILLIIIIIRHKKVDIYPDNNNDNLFKNQVNNKTQEQTNNKTKEQDKKEEQEEKETTNVTVRDSIDCIILDPIFMLKQRIETRPIFLCNSDSSKHTCYKNRNTYINRLFATKDGVVCTMENIIIDPIKWIRDNGSIPGNKGAPLLAKGFYNAKCDTNQTINEYGVRYNQYFDAWDYDYKENMNDIEELAPGKTIFLLSRNGDSLNMYHGGCEIINAIALMYLLNLKPEDIKVIFLESFDMKLDPFYDMYKILVSRGGYLSTSPILKKNSEFQKLF